jgi:heptosyltransferase-2
VSVWPTKTLPPYKWVELIRAYRSHYPENDIYLIGAGEEFGQAEVIRNQSGNERVLNLCGKLSLLQSAALMKRATMNYVNDSAPLHMASAMNAPVTAVYCSTVPRFGFGPLSDVARIVETKLALKCRPCGLHGYRECPLVHFKCAHSIEINEVLGK